MTPRHSRSSEEPRAPARALDDVLFVVGRVYFNYVGVVERVLKDKKIDHLIAPGMGQILFALFEKDDRIIKEIAERVGLSQSTLTGLLTRMEKSGLIDRKRDAVDGRAVRVRLTTLGRSLEDRCWSVLEEMRSLVRKALSDDETATLRDGLNKLSASLRAKAED